MGQFRKALRTTDLTVSRRKEFELRELKPAEWDLLALGEDALAYQKYQAAKEVSEEHGFAYLPSEVLLKRTFVDNLLRLLAGAGTTKMPQPKEVTEAILGVLQ